PLEQTRAQVNIHLDQRQKGLLWFSTYTSDFAGRFTFRNDSGARQQLWLRLPYPSERAVYENMNVRVNGKPVNAITDAGMISAQSEVEPGEAVVFEAAYRSHGMDDWSYSFGENVTQLHDFELKLATDFKNLDFAD